MRVCDYCGATLALSEGEQQVLARGRSNSAQFGYTLQLGDRLAIEGSSYEIIGRVCVYEDDDPAYRTQQYYLYHPRREPLWLSQYFGETDLTRRTRVRPVGDPFDMSRGQLRTHDGRVWTQEEAGQTAVAHVDGALPYLQRVGDRQRFRVLSGAGGSFYEITQGDGEVEYNVGRSVSAPELAEMLGRPLSPVTQPRPSPPTPPSQDPRFALTLIGLGGLTVVVLAALFLVSLLDEHSGTRTVNCAASPASIRANTLCGPFELDEEETVRVDVWSGLINAWFYVQAALVVDDRDTVVTVGDTEISHYAGPGWDEDHERDRIYLTAPEDGEYYLLLGGTSGHGEHASDVPQHSMNASVFRRATRLAPAAHVGMLLAILIALGLAGAWALAVNARWIQSGRMARWGMGVVVAGVLMHAVVVAGALVLGASGALAPEPEHPDGISIRQSSLPGRPGAPFLLLYDDPRGHLGGGVHAGK